MTLTASEVASLADTLTKWEYAEYFFAGLVTLACFGEFVADFTDWFTKGVEHRKKRLEKLSTLVLVGALALELVCLVTTNSLSGQLIGSLNELATGADDKAKRALVDSNTAITQSGQATIKARSAEEVSGRAADKSGKAEGTASNAMTLARDARREADSFEKDIVSAKEQAASAESRLLELREKIKPRMLSSEQSAAFVKALRAFPNGVINFGYTSGGADEGFNFATTQILPLFESAGWSVRNRESISNHLDIQVTGVAVLTRGAPLPNPNLPPSASNRPPGGPLTLTPTLEAIQSAFRAAGVQVQFTNFPVDIPEVVIGSKP